MSGLNRYLRSSASKVAASRALAIESKSRDDSAGLAVTPKRGRRGTPMSRLIHYYRTGPWDRQVGIVWLHGECLPRMQRYFRHTFKHATKGWRTYSGGPSMTMPAPSRQRVYPQAFYGSHLGIPA